MDIDVFGIPRQFSFVALGVEWYPDLEEGIEGYVRKLGVGEEGRVVDVEEVVKCF